MEKLKQLLPMHLQFFAEGGEGTGEENPGGENPGGTDTGTDEITFDEKQQSEVDRRISKAVDNALKKHDEKTQKLIDAEVEKARKKAEEYSKLTEREKLEKDLQEREDKLAAERRELETIKLKTEVEKDLIAQELPTSLAEVLVKAEDNETIKSLIADIKKTVDAKVNEGIKVGLRQETPKDNVNMSGGGKGNQSIVEFAQKNRIIKD